MASRRKNPDLGHLIEVAGAVLALLGIVASHDWSIVRLLTSAGEGERYGVAALLGVIWRAAILVFTKVRP